MSVSDATDRERQETGLPELWKVSRVAEALDVSGPTVYRLMDSGELPYVRIGERSRRVKKSDVVAYLERATVQRA